MLRTVPGTLQVLDKGWLFPWWKLGQSPREK